MQYLESIVATSCIQQLIDTVAALRIEEEEKEETQVEYTYVRMLPVKVLVNTRLDTFSISHRYFRNLIVFFFSCSSLSFSHF